MPLSMKVSIYRRVIQLAISIPQLTVNRYQKCQNGQNGTESALNSVFEEVLATGFSQKFATSATRQKILLYGMFEDREAS
jgi:hypothetical protein